MKKKILWISRHGLVTIQKNMIFSVHGKRGIDRIDIRFEDCDHLFRVLEEYKNTHFVYATIPQKWREQAVQNGYSVGKLSEPKITRIDGRKYLHVDLSFFGGINILRKESKRVLGAKGYKCPRGKKRR